ncbi:MAG: endolytic transglycosylase MltG [Candidatus Paceibacterota bacterium]
MEPLGTWLERAFALSERIQAKWSLRWQEHTNRRTIIVSLVVGALLTGGYLTAIQPPENFPIGELVSVPSGDNLTQVATALQRDGVIRSAFAFRALIMILGHERTVRAGDYLFKEPRDVFSIARAMSIGAFGLEPFRILIPEGATTKRMAVIYSSRLERFDAANFLAQAQPMEGYLFPDTYFFLPNATEDTVIQTMRQNFDTRIAEIDPLVQSFGKPLSDVVIMASIIEREARNSEDRRKISGVLWNRIKKGMALQVDVTFLYTIGKGTFQLTMKDLMSDSPYNTYVNKGLPPTAIGSPSMDSLRAAVDPVKSDYLYFLADRNGVTHFCKTYSCQLANKARYF